MKDYVKFIKLFVSKYRGELITGTICASINMALLMASPMLTSIIIDKVIINKNQELLKEVLIVMIFVLIFNSVLHFLYSLLLNKTFLRLGYDLKVYIFRHISKFDVSVINKLPTGMLSQRIFNDSEVIKSSLGQVIFGVCLNAIYIIFICSYMMIMNWQIAVFVILAQSLQVVLVLASRNKLRNLAVDRKSITETVVSRTIEIINSFNLVKACRNEPEEVKRFELNLETATKIAYKESVLMTFIGELSNVINGIVSFGVLWYGGMLVINNNLTIGNLTAFILIGNMLGTPINAVVSVILGFQDILASNRRIFEILNMENKNVNIKSPIYPNFKGEVKFENVNFGYNDSSVLKNTSFEVKPHTISAIVGKSGVGKTTICMLLARFYEPNSGTIKVDGYDIKNIDMGHYRQSVGIVLQNDFVISGTVRDNIQMGNKEATNDEIVNAAKLANAHEFISNLPDGYWTFIGERGKQLSGGQAQRIALARLFLNQPKIVLLDEATSFIDIESEELIKEAILRLADKATVFIITHKLSTVKIASKVLVLEEGAIVEQGSHEELVSLNGTYSNLFKKILA